MKTDHDGIKNHASTVRYTEQRVNDARPVEPTGGGIAAGAQAPALELQPDRSTALLDALYENMRLFGQDSAMRDAAMCFGAGLRFHLTINGPHAALYLLAQAEVELAKAIALERDAPSARLK